ncbi:unnamed protein product, partial [Mesorhabditis spiculigera]
MPFWQFLLLVFCLEAYARNLTSHNGCVIDPARPCDFVNSTWVLDDDPYFLWPFDEDEAVAKNWTQFEDAQIEAISKFCSVGDYQHRLLLAHFHWMAKDQILLEEIRKYFGLTPRRNGYHLEEGPAENYAKIDQNLQKFLEKLKKNVPNEVSWLKNLTETRKLLDEELPIIRKIFQLFLQHQDYKEIPKLDKRVSEALRISSNTLKEAIMACELHKFEQASSGFLESVKKMEADMAKHLVA